MKTQRSVIKFLSWLVCFSVFMSFSVKALTLPNTPLGVTAAAKPMTMIVAGKDHKLYYEAYNDASDIDGDGSLDIHFTPSIIYYGLFDSGVCYKYDSSGLFNPSTTSTATGKCSAEWSGNWLNYITTSRIDALRVVLYGGFREVDSTSETILRRAYIPQDAHSWSKEYTSEAVDGYKISDYSPVSQPSAGKRHFFGNLTPNSSIDCSTLDTCSDIKPQLSVITNTSKRVWEWASKERPVLDGSHGGSRTNYVVRVKVCTTPFYDGCVEYPNGSFKPTGLLHDYGENEAMLFGLLTGSYDKHMSGGRLRKVMSSFKDEVDENTGIFTANAEIVNTFNNLRIRGFNQNSKSNEYLQYSPYAKSAKKPTEGEFIDWGNPVAEMMYEATRYLAGKGLATSGFDDTLERKLDKEVGLSSAPWDDPYDTVNSAAKAPWCARASMLVISDSNTSFDSDSLPGSYFNSGFAGDLAGLNVEKGGDTITAGEPDVVGPHFIGQSATVFDSAPTVKKVTSLGNIRGIAPEEPNKEGSYYSASLAYFAKTNNLRSPVNPKEKQEQIADSFVVSLASQLPRFRAELANGEIIEIVPFAKSVGGAGISNAKGNYQPTDQIVDFYIAEIANTGPSDKDSSVNGGRYYVKFRISYEDVEQGGDHDMDAISEYEIRALSDGTLRVIVTPLYQSGGIKQNMGYVISGSTRDGVYLVVQDENTFIHYYLNTPPGFNAGDCDVTSPSNSCKRLPYISQNSNRIFTAAKSGEAATLLENPLWYTAKWGGFVDKNKNNIPDLSYEWDADNDGVPDTYFLVQNPSKLKDSLKKAFNNILARSGSGSNVTSNSTSVSTDSLLFQSLFNTVNWSGNLLAFPIDISSGVASIAKWEAKNGIPLPAARQIYTTSNGVANKFEWGNLSPTDQAALGSEEIFNYLRGDRTKEIQNGGAMRDRTTHVLGDIVHSSPFYVKETNTVYVGANDGMLHGFDASNGEEQFAYIPSDSLSRLKKISQFDYGSSNNPHEYFVDGSIVVSNQSQTSGHNYLVSTLGEGGKGLFGLDVTTPGSFSATNVKWEYFDTSDPDLGYMLGQPVIAKINDGTMVVIVGNGYNSVSGKAVLYIFNLSTGALIKKIDTEVAGDNGLASPGVYDSDGDGAIDYVYAGDLKGNVWKFDITNKLTSKWGSSFKSGSTPEPLFIAKDALGNTQPITAQMTIAYNEGISTDPLYKKRFIIFGTGSYFDVADPIDMDVQSWYGLIDDDAQISSRSDLTQRKIVEEGTFSGKAVRTFSEVVLTPTHDMTGKKGWYMDLTQANGTAEGERIVTASIVYRLAEPVLISSSIIPVIDPCIPGGRGYINAINPFTGGRLSLGFFDINGNDDFDDDQLNNINIGSLDLGISMPGQSVLISNFLSAGGSEGEVGSVKVNLGATDPSGRVSWIELINN